MSFADELRAFAEKAEENANRVLRAVCLEILKRIVARSPVGNPELWKANQRPIYRRQTHNLFAQRINADILANPANFTRGGRLKRGVKLARVLSGRTLARTYTLRTGNGYVGGRFRGSWVMTIGTPSEEDPGRIDPSGNSTISANAAIVRGLKMGVVVYLMSNLPYSRRLEYGHSKQAPAGVVRITAAEFQDIVNIAVESIHED